MSRRLVGTPWRRKLQAPIRLRDGRSLLNLADVRQLAFEIVGADSDDGQIQTVIQLMTIASADPTHRNMCALQDVLLVALEAKDLA